MVKTVEQSFPMFGGIFADSVAVVNGNTVKVKLKNAVFFDKNLIAQKIKETVNDAVINGKNVVVE